MVPQRPSQHARPCSFGSSAGNARRTPAAKVEETELPGRAWCREVSGKLLAWYDRHARVLPWRQSRDPYRVWLSEVMLQQTRVDSVVRYFERFLARFPTIEALAEADSQQVLRLWEGLGYYRRAMQLHRAAQIVVEQFGGELPADPHRLQQLPGIGRYTAGAICSIAFAQRVPILEANTQRLYARLIALSSNLQTSGVQRLLWQLAERLLPEKRPGRFNQAAMELGSQVCTVGKPKCGQCPVAACCEAFARGLQGEIPPPKRRAAVEDRREIALVVRRRGKLLLRQCGEDRWTGLWDFPCLAVAGGRMPSPRAVARRALQQWGLQVAIARRVATIRYSITRYRFERRCLEASHQRGPGGQLSPAAWRWVLPRQLDQYPLCRPARRLARMLAGDDIE